MCKVRSRKERRSQQVEAAANNEQTRHKFGCPKIHSLLQDRSFVNPENMNYELHDILMIIDLLMSMFLGLDGSRIRHNLWFTHMVRFSVERKCLFIVAPSGVREYICQK